MAWSLIKILLFVTAIAVISLAASQIAEIGSEIRLVIADYELSMSPVVFTVGIVLLFPAFWLLYFFIGLIRACISFLMGDETALSRYFNKNREHRGYEALADGLLAMASGEPKLAMTKAVRAEHLLNRPEITGIVTAQAAERAGDTPKAIAAYKNLLNDDRTKFAGISGLLKHKIAEGDTTTALALAEKAFALRPQHDDLQNTLLKLQSVSEDWAGAQKTLAAKLKHRRIPRDVYKRRDAVLAFAEGRRKIQSGENEEGEQDVLAANKHSPGLIPAAVLACRIKARAGDKKSATSIIRRAWSIQPHPELAAAFAELEPDEDPNARKGRFERMIGKDSTHPEARMLMAELSIADEDFAQARREIASLADENPTVRSLAIMAAVERGQGADDAVVRGWLTKAVTASRGPQWVCDVCGQIHSEWVPVCKRCQGFDTLDWTEASETVELPAVQDGLLMLVASNSGSEAESSR